MTEPRRPAGARRPTATRSRPPYLLMALPTASIGAAFVVDELRPRGRGWAFATVGVIAALVAAQLPFLVL
jgi:hypothetical protein